MTCELQENSLRDHKQFSSTDLFEHITAFNAPESLVRSMSFFLELLEQVLKEYDPSLADNFQSLLELMIQASYSETTHEKSLAYARAQELFETLSLDCFELLIRSFGCYFHLANICEEHYRMQSLEQRSNDLSKGALPQAYDCVKEELGSECATRLLARLEFHPVFTAHPTEARRKATEGKIRRIAQLLSEYEVSFGLHKEECKRKLLQEIDALFRTSPIALKKPNPVEEADTIIGIFDNTLFDMVVDVYRDFDYWLQKETGCEKPLCPAFFRPGSWIGSDRDGNPNVDAKTTIKVSEKLRIHMLETLSREIRRIGKNLTLETLSTPPSDELYSLWNHQVEMSEVITGRAYLMSEKELHRAVMLVIANRLEATIQRTAYVMYNSAQDLLKDLYCVQDSLVKANCKRSAYGPLQDIIWQVETFGFHMVEMELRQHSQVHAEALEDILAQGENFRRLNSLQPKTKEVLDTFRAIATIQRKNGIDSARRYIVSFTKSAKDIQNVYTLCELAFAHKEDVPVLDVIPLFEQIEDLNKAVCILDEMIRIPQVHARLQKRARKLEVMLGYSDSSKDAGPTSATLALHNAQMQIAQWAQQNEIDLVLFHGRGGAVGRGGGPANRAVLAQPKGSVNTVFKLTEQGEVIFARYGNEVLAKRHVDSVAGATLLNSAPSIETLNSQTFEKFTALAQKLDEYSRARYLSLLHTKGFTSWFATVTPLHEIGLLPLGSRPAKRGIFTSSLDDLRTIPWVFSWAQARVNLAAWYGLGSACKAINDLAFLQQAYKEWPLFSAFIDNIEMSLAKCDDMLALMYLELGDRSDFVQIILTELSLTREWVLKILDAQTLLQNRRVLGPVVKLRLPFVNALSLMQVEILRKLRRSDEILLSDERKNQYLQLLLCTVSGVAAGLQNTG